MRWYGRSARSNAEDCRGSGQLNGAEAKMTRRPSAWLALLVPVVLAVLMLVPLSCVGGSASCAAGTNCPPDSAPTCYSLLGIPSNAGVAALGVMAVAVVSIVVYLRRLRSSAV